MIRPAISRSEMASPMAVQDYLQKHRIGALFEDLMAKVISDMPDEPCLYLSRVLHLRAEKKDFKGLMRSGELDTRKATHDKPWQVNSKKIQPKSPTKKATTVGRPEFDHRTGMKKQNTGLDDIWGEAKTSKKTQDSLKASKGNASAWLDSNVEDGEDVMFSAYGYRGPRGKRYDDDPLKGELVVMDETPSRSSEGHTTKSGKKKHGRQDNSLNHKNQLEQYVKCRQKAADSGYEEDQDTYDDAVELLEDDMELKREGVLNAKKSGVRISGPLRRSASVQTNVKVSICARCATIMGGGQPSEPSREPMTSRTAASTARSLKAPTELDPAPFNVIPSDDDEFESVSQVTGPRRPVWQESDNEAVTPRKGKSMLASNLSPSKGLPMYSNSAAKKTGQGVPTHSVDFSHGQRTDSLRDNPLNRTWSPMRATDNVFGRNDDDDEGSGAEDTTAGWQVPPDYDTDSSFYGSPAGKPQRLDRAY